MYFRIFRPALGDIMDTDMTVPSNILQHVRTYDTYSMHIKHNTAGTLLFISNYVLVRLRTVTTIRYTSV